MILIFIIPIYILLNAYILHRIHKWLTACSERFHSKWFVVPYLTIYSLLALSLLFAFLLPASEFQVLVKRISNYWLGTFLYLLMFIAVAAELYLPFYKLIGIGLTAIYGTQVFLTIGGGIKFIPLTGVTLPLVSYGGSSVLSTFIIFGIMQELYIKRQNEVERLERIKERVHY